jgi:hypothetical protein
MFSYPPLLLLQLAAAAAVTAILCVVCHRDAEIDVRFWLAVAVAAAVLFVAEQSKAQSPGGADRAAVVAVVVRIDQAPGALRKA